MQPPRSRRLSWRHAVRMQLSCTNLNHRMQPSRSQRPPCCQNSTPGYDSESQDAAPSPPALVLPEPHLLTTILSRRMQPCCRRQPSRCQNSTPGTDSECLEPSVQRALRVARTLFPGLVLSVWSQLSRVSCSSCCQNPIPEIGFECPEKVVQRFKFFVLPEPQFSPSFGLALAASPCSDGSDPQGDR